MSEALFYEPAFDHPRTKSDSVFNYILLLEHIIGCADHMTVHHYEMGAGKADPVFADSPNRMALEFCNQLHAEILELVAQNRALVAVFRQPATCRASLAALTASFFKKPTRGSAKALADLPAASDQNNLNPMPIVKPLDLWTTLLPVLSNRRASATGHRHCFWPEGAFAMSPPITRWTLKLMRPLSAGAGRLAPLWHRLTMRIAIRTRLHRLLQSPE